MPRKSRNHDFQISWNLSFSLFMIILYDIVQLRN